MTGHADHDDPIPRLTSPDGSVEVLFRASEMRMSVWVFEPIVVRTRDGAAVVDLDGTLLDASTGTTFPGPGLVRMRLRRYPRGDRVAYDLVVDVEAETFGLGEEEPVRPLYRLRTDLGL